MKVAMKQWNSKNNNNGCVHQNPTPTIGTSPVGGLTVHHIDGLLDFVVVSELATASLAFLCLNKFILVCKGNS